MFAQLSVFVGGWTLGAAAAVMPGGATRALDGLALDLISRLADKSLIRVVRRERRRAVLHARRDPRVRG